MLRKTLATAPLLALGLLLSGCTAHLKEQSFIAQDDKVNRLTEQNMQEWQGRFANHRLKPITLITQHDNTRLTGLWLDHPDTQDTIYYVPGNGMKLERGGIQAMATLAKLNKDLVIFDRRGLGASEGTATINGLILDAVEQVQYIKRELNASSLVLHGFSLGSFVAAQVTKHESVDALVLQGAATNVDEWIDERIPWYSKPFLTVKVDEIFHTVDNKQIVSETYSGPLLIIGGEKDEQAPASLSQALFDASQSSNKQLVIVRHADHNSMLNNQSEIDIYRTFLSSFKGK